MRIPLLLISILFFQFTFGQSVPQRTIVEHFTNTRCSICGSKNPNFYPILDMVPGVLHIAYHPSSPYSNCYFSQQNPTENDNRTKFYGLYGATPQATVQGVPVTPKPTIVTVQEIDRDEYTWMDVQVTQTDAISMSGQVKVKVVVTAIDTPQQPTALLYVAVAEDTVWYNAPNGEDIHPNVFRKAVFDDGLAVVLPSAIGDSLVVNGIYTPGGTWDIDRLQTYAMIHDLNTKEIFQVGQSNYVNQNPSGIPRPPEARIKVYPNPATDFVIIENVEPAHIRLVNTAGQLIQQWEISPGTTTLPFDRDLPAGIYILSAHSVDRSQTVVMMVE